MSGVINERVYALKLEAMDRITCDKLKSPEKVWKTEVAEIGHQKAMDQTDLSCDKQAHQVLARVLALLGGRSVDRS